MKGYLEGYGTPRWIIFVIDLAICTASLLAAYLVRFNFSIPRIEIETFPIAFSVVLVVRSISFMLGKTHFGVIRYTGSSDTQRIFRTITFGSLLFFILNYARFYLLDGKFVLPISIVIIDYLATIFLMISFRMSVKMIFSEFKNITKVKSKVIIFGAGEAGVLTKRTLDHDNSLNYDVIAFVDDNKKLRGKKVEGVTIHGGEKLNELLQKVKVDELIISVQKLPKARKTEIVETCLPYNIKIFHVPPVRSWINGELSHNQIKQVKIVDLLGREPIRLDTLNIETQIKRKVVLITGAAGSIGSEIARQVCDYFPEKIYLLDQAESPLYEIDIELAEKIGKGICEPVIADVSNYNRMRKVFETFKPQVVYHAAAYKHVPIMEENPSEAVLTNIRGSKIAIDLSNEFGVEKFVMISTDKAVNPTNVMGASKRVAEMYAQAVNANSKTNYITTRFGNVLGSNGSVIPLFQKQIESGGPVTITHPEITRYFMTIPEACQLVLEAGALGMGGEIFIFDMGQPIKIMDLAKKMIKLSGLSVGKDIQIQVTGLRPGEKLYEELLANEENTIPTHHPQILKAKLKAYSVEELQPRMDKLIAEPSNTDNYELVKLIKELVPEYKSQNSVYSRLDHKES
ncbi:MAG: polysaccharide biosynthesis protein [Flavobacteriales bacterium]|nr:polysaccharide biosynthesis protein [Flavobacteriales bacterium]